MPTADNPKAVRRYAFTLARFRFMALLCFFKASSRIPSRTSPARISFPSGWRLSRPGDTTVDWIPGIWGRDCVGIDEPFDAGWTLMGAGGLLFGISRPQHS